MYQWIQWSTAAKKSLTIVAYTRKKSEFYHESEIGLKNYSDRFDNTSLSTLVSTCIQLVYA